MGRGQGKRATAGARIGAEVIAEMSDTIHYVMAPKPIETLPPKHPKLTPAERIICI